jgi:hypothetical protein
MVRARRAWRKGVREEPALYVLHLGHRLKTWRIRAGRSAHRCPRVSRELPGGIRKPYREAAADPGRRFDDLFNLVHDPATLLMAFCRVAGNQGANTPGVDGVAAAYVKEVTGVLGFLDDLRAALKDGSFRPLPVRERMIPKPGGSGKLRRLGIPAIADRVVQAALKLVPPQSATRPCAPGSGGMRATDGAEKVADGADASAHADPAS